VSLHRLGESLRLGNIGKTHASPPSGIQPPIPATGVPSISLPMPIQPLRISESSL
jgi:hypothetical protein